MGRSRGGTGNAEGTGPWNASTDFLRPYRVNEAQMSRRGRDANMPTHQLREVHRLTHVLVGEGHLGGEAVPEGGVAVHIIHGDKGTGRFMRGCSLNNTVRWAQ